MSKQQLKTQFQEHIKKKYAKYWDESIVDFLRDVAEETGELGDNTFFDVLEVKLNDDTIALEGISDRTTIFEFSVMLRSQEFGWSNSYWQNVDPRQTLKEFITEKLPGLLDEYEKECVNKQQ